jgi:hypothetical protein
LSTFSTLLSVLWTLPQAQQGFVFHEICGLCRHYLRSKPADAAVARASDPEAPEHGAMFHPRIHYTVARRLVPGPLRRLDLLQEHGQLLSDFVEPAKMTKQETWIIAAVPHLALPIFLMILFTTPAHPAEIKLQRGEITITGTIEKDDWMRFIALVPSKEDPIIVLNSKGGWTGPAEYIGRFIRTHKLTTLVRNGDKCNSACVLIWISGLPRLMEPKAMLGFHSTSFSENRRKRNDDGNLKFGEFLRSMGAPRQIIELQPKADPTSMNYVDYKQALAWGLFNKPTPPPSGLSIEEHELAKNMGIDWFNPTPIMQMAR